MSTVKYGNLTAVICRRHTLIGVMLAAAIQSAYGETGKTHFDIPAQPLHKALLVFGKQSRHQLMYSTDIAENQRSHALQGDYSVSEALNILLSETPLQAVTATDDGTISLQRKAPALYNSSDALPTVTVSANAAHSNTFAEPEDHINYFLSNTSSATKTDTPIMETPASVQVVSRALMNDQQSTSLEDSLNNITSVQGYLNTFGTNPLIRGFNTSNSIYRNGLRLDDTTSLEVAQLSRIEVLKGPTSVLYGRMQPGGAVDLVTNRPQEQANYSLQQQFGSYALYRTVLDATGPVLEDKSLLYRLNFVYKANNSFRDYVSADHVFLMPSLTWRPSDSFETNVNMEYQHDNFTGDNGVVAVNTAPLQMPISTFLGYGTAMQNNPRSQDRVLAAFDWNYRFTDDWKLTNRFQYNKTEYPPSEYYFPVSLSKGNSLNMGVWDVPTTYTSFQTNLDLTGNFDTGFAHHSVLLGYDYYNYNGTASPSHNYFFGSFLSPVNIYNPNNNQASVNLAVLPVNYSYKQFNNWNGFYIQDQISLWDQVHILLGGRWDWSSYGAASGKGLSLDSFSAPAAANNAFKPRVGLVYQPWEWGSVYGNYTQSLGVSNGLSATGQAFAPQSATQYEVGAKTEFFDKRLMATLALYSITQNNTLTTNPQNPLTQIPVGQARSKGVEFQVQGQASKNISLIAGYAYDSAKILAANNGQQGNMLPNVPLNSGNFWGKYAFDNELLPDLNLSGLSIGSGLYLQGMRQGDTANSFQLPGYARWDASVTYSFEQFGGKISTQLNVYNLLNKVYYANSGGSSLMVYPGAPLTFMGSVKVEF